MSKRMPAAVFVLNIALAFGPAINAQSGLDVPGLTVDQIKAIFNEVSGDRAWNHIAHLCLHHRWCVSDGYHAAAEYVSEQARAAGLKNVEIEGFKSDGNISYATSRSLPKWSVTSATLELVKPIQKHLVSWDESPITLASNSRSANLAAELVDVGEGVRPADYEGKDVAGKLVLASSPQDKGRIEQVHRLAVLERGAAGVVSYRGYEMDDFPDLITWDHIWTLERDGRPSTFGFCLPKRMGWQLKRLLDQGGKVVLRVAIDADISPGQFEIVKGTIPGTDLAGQEIWFIAHLDHTRPSANDNASGSAAILEAARTFGRLFDTGALPRPRRTIRFFWVPEIDGTFAYVSTHLDEAKRAVAVINMDMVGENQKLCGSTFNVTKTPDSTPSYLNDLLESCLGFMLAQTRKRESINDELDDPFAAVSPSGTRDNWSAEIIPYSGGSDHAVFLGGGINIPATMFGSWPDYFYHSSGDTPDKSDPTQLKRAIICGVLAATSLATIEDEAGLALLQTMVSRGILRQGQAADTALAFLEKSKFLGEDLRTALNIVRQKALHEVEALSSMKALLPGDANMTSRIEKLSAEVLAHRDLGIKRVKDRFFRDSRAKDEVPETVGMSADEKRAIRRIPRRNEDFPGYFEGEFISLKLREKKLPAVQVRLNGFQRFETAAFINGRRDILEIWNAVRAETGPVELSDIISYLNMLESIGLIAFNEPRGS